MLELFAQFLKYGILQSLAIWKFTVILPNADHSAHDFLVPLTSDRTYVVCVALLTQASNIEILEQPKNLTQKIVLLANCKKWHFAHFKVNH